MREQTSDQSIDTTQVAKAAGLGLLVGWLPAWVVHGFVQSAQHEALRSNPIGVSVDPTRPDTLYWVTWLLVIVGTAAGAAALDMSRRPR